MCEMKRSGRMGEGWKVGYGDKAKNRKKKKGGADNFLKKMCQGRKKRRKVKNRKVKEVKRLITGKREKK